MPQSGTWFVRVLAAVRRGFWRGLVHYGAWVCGAVVDEAWSARAFAPRPEPTKPIAMLLPGPPAGHPERAGAHVPPSAVEVQLWTQLERLDGR